MATTVRDLINGALRLNGSLAAGETASAQEASDALTALNQLLESWSLESLMIDARVREEFPLVGGQSVYKMGPVAADPTVDFNTARPIVIENALIKETGINPPLELLIEVVTKDEWAAIPVKGTPSTLPTKLYVEGTAPIETLNLWPVPSEAKTLVLYSRKPLTAFASLNTPVTSLPPGYYRALRYNLAIELAPEYGVAVSTEVASMAVESKANVKRKNIRPVYAAVDEALMSRNTTFNYLTGE